jgi:hypothetical protein
MEIGLILLKPPRHRTLEDVKSLMGIVSAYKFFRDLTQRYKSDEALVNCCKEMTYEYVKADNYLFKYGDRGSKFYVILKGR